MTTRRTFPALRRHLEKQLANGTLEVPLLPEVARRVMEMTHRESTSGSDLTQLIHRDQALAAQVLRVANSAALAGGVRIVSLQQAVARLGMVRLADVAMATSLKGGLFDVPGFEKALRGVWRHSFASALFGRAIARSLRRSVDTAFLCGLLHRVGRPLVYGEIAHKGRAAAGKREAMAELVEDYQIPFALVAAEQWALPLPVVEAIAHCDAYERADDYRDEAAMTFLASRLATAVLDPEGQDEKVLRDHRVFADLNLYPETVEEILAEKDAIYESVEAATP